jgi:acetolactate synthase-1/2/3 large subunit
MIKLSDYVFKFVARQKVKHVFLIPGGGNMHLTNSLSNVKDIKPVACLHEQGCSFAAESYGEYNNSLGVALVTSGPGGTNCVTGVAAAWIESSPTLFISGQAKRADLILASGVRSMGQQEVDIVSIVKPITKYAVTVMEPESIRYHLEKAVYLAKSGRPGPVWIDMPLDVQSAVINEKSLAGFTPAAASESTASEIKQKVRQTVDLIKLSKRPVFLIGNGVRISGAADEFRKLLESLHIPVLLTWKAADILSENHPLYAGRPGGIGQRFANFTQQNADCIIIIGARLDLPSLAFDHKNFARGAKKIVVDIDLCEISKFQFKINVAVHGQAVDFINELSAQSHSLQDYDCSPWLKRVKEWQKKYPVILPEYWDNKDYASTYVLMGVLSELLSEDDLIVPGSAGSCSDILMQAFKVKAGQRVLNAPGLGAMGTGIPGSIGACLASGCRRTICINGDGGFFLNIQELEVAKRLNLPIKYFVLNNNGYGSIVLSQSAHFKKLVAANPDSGFTLPDVKTVAEAFGIKTMQISKNDQLRNVIKDVVKTAGPVVCEVMVNPQEKTIPRVTSKITPDGNIVSNPMEDMSPLLGREELKENMIIPITIIND